MTIRTKADASTDYALHGYASAANREIYRQTPAFKKRSRAWNEAQCGRYAMVGGMMDLMRKYEPSSLAEWEHVYLNHGRSLHHLQKEVAKLYKDYTGVSSREALLSVLLHTIDATWRGSQLELSSLNLLRHHAQVTAPERKIIFRLSTKWEDAHYAVDIVAFEEGALAYAWQVKPSSFWARGVAEDVKRIEQLKLADFERRYPNAVVSYLSSYDIDRREVKFIF
jgi:hypothetical protein